MRHSGISDHSFHEYELIVSLFQIVHVKYDIYPIGDETLCPGNDKFLVRLASPTVRYKYFRRHGALIPELFRTNECRLRLNFTLPRPPPVRRPPSLHCTVGQGRSSLPGRSRSSALVTPTTSDAIPRARNLYICG